MKQEKAQTETTAAQRSLKEFLDFAMMRQPPGEGLPEDATPLLKNLWFTMNRRRAGFDWLLRTHCRKLRPGMDWLLRWVLTECYAMDALPPPIAVSVMVDEAKRRFTTSEANFLNAVARSILREAPDAGALAALYRAKAPAAVQCELPPALYERWCKAHGEAWVRQLAALLQEPAATTARERGCFVGATPQWPARLEEFVKPSPTEFDPQKYYLQDASTLMAPLMLAPRSGEMVADLCAAPGGKALILAELLGGTGVLYACDASPRRLGRLQENLGGFSNVRIEKQNAKRPKLAAGTLDALLLDVPCSNTGVIRRRPDVRWNFAPTELQRLTAEQWRILEGSAGLVKPGGRLVYSTCSLEPEENNQQVKRFLERHSEFALVVEEQLYPTTEHDGAYAALLKRC